MESIVLNSKEYMPVKVKDRLNNLTTLDTTLVQFKVDNEDDTNIIDWSTASSEGMTALPLVDGSLLTKGIFKLYIRFNLAPEVPILGPFEFEVV